MPNEKKTNGGHNNVSPSFQAFYERAIMAFTRKKKRADAVKERERGREDRLPEVTSLCEVIQPTSFVPEIELEPKSELGSFLSESSLTHPVGNVIHLKVKVCVCTCVCLVAKTLDSYSLLQRRILCNLRA